MPANDAQWRAIRHGNTTRPWRVGRTVRGCLEWHRGYSRYPAVRRGPVITFSDIGAAINRASALNLNERTETKPSAGTDA